MFAKILVRLDQQDKIVDERHHENKEVLDGILEQTTNTNGRVTKLEENWKYALGWIAGAAFVILGVLKLVDHFVK